jgi:hypothetical protein
VQAHSRRGEAIPRARRFLEELQGAGWVACESVLEAAASIGISFRTLERAKAELGIQSQQRRENGRNLWYWRLPLE